MPTIADMRAIEQAVSSKFPSALIQRAPSADDPSWLTIRLGARVFVADLQPDWGICIDELRGDERPFDNAYAYVEKTANAAIHRLIALMGTASMTNGRSPGPIVPPQ